MQTSIEQMTGHACGTAPGRWREDGTPGGLDASHIAELLEELDTAVIVCCEEGRVALANNVARRELLCGKPLFVNTGGLLCLTAGARSALLPWRSALRGAVQARRRQLLALRDGPHCLMVSVMPLCQQTDWALVMLGRRQPAPELAVQMLSNLYELTQAEQHVLVRLLDGQRVDSIAKARGVKLSTLRTQVSTLREKLGASRLEDLVRMAAELPPMGSALRSPALWAANRSDTGPWLATVAAQAA
jgi:DNA-binding CsgD family transcriptional regulator